MLSIQELFATIPEIHVAHRGASAQYPENTMSAFTNAAHFGAHMIELDVHLTADEQLVVMHDATLDRTTNGTGPIASLRWSDMEYLDAGSWRNPASEHMPIPRLGDVLRWLPNHLCVNIELKGIPQNKESLAKNALKEVMEYECEDRVLLSSFNHELLAVIRHMNTEIPLGAIYCGRPWPLLSLAETLQLFSLHAHIADIDREWAQRVLSGGYEVVAWTLRHASQVHHCRQAGVKALVVDDLSLLTTPYNHSHQNLFI